jgi:hypothetical protein
MALNSAVEGYSGLSRHLGKKKRKQKCLRRDKIVFRYCLSSLFGFFYVLSIITVLLHINTAAHQGLMRLYSSTAGSTSGRRDFQLRQTGDKAQGESVRHDVSQLDTR